MGNKHLRRSSHKPKNDNFWWYECADGLQIYHEDGKETIDKFTIPWKIVANAVDRKYNY